MLLCKLSVAVGKNAGVNVRKTPGGYNKWCARKPITFGSMSFFSPPSKSKWESFCYEASCLWLPRQLPQDADGFKNKTHTM